MSESAVERRVVHYAARYLGIYSVKLTSTGGSTGWPDREFFIPGGRPLFIEFKTAKGRITKRQEYIHEQLRAAGYVVEVHHEFYAASQSILNALDAARISNPRR